MTNFEIVQKLIGSIRPAGHAGKDQEILENMKSMISLTEGLIFEIGQVAHIYQDSYEQSVQRVQEEAKQFMDENIK